MTACIAADCPRELRDTESQWGMVICTPCVDRMRATLRAIPAALIVLREGSMQRERTGETGRAGTREAPLPCRLDTLNLIGPAATGTVHDPYGDQIGQRPIVDVLGSWVRLLCEERGINAPEAWSEVALAGWLASQLGFAATQGWVAEMAGELRDLTWAIRGIARVEVRTRAISRPCPRCELLTLARTDHDSYTRCSSCGTAWTDSELNADAEQRAAA
jgi:hypothetical protein